VYLEAISYKLGLNLISDLGAIGVVPDSIRMDYYLVNSAGYGLTPGLHNKKSFSSFSAAKTENSNYVSYMNSDRSGYSVGVEAITGAINLYNYNASIRIYDILGNYTVSYSFPSDVQRTEEITRAIDFHRLSVESLINSYKSEYTPFVTLFPTIYAFIHAEPGYYNLTQLLEAKRQIIMNKRI
jgi:hypothetical protein